MGLSDDSPTATRVRFETVVNGATVSDQILGLGQSVPLDVDVTGRLRLRVVAIIQPGSHDDARYRADWADVRAIP